MKFPSGVFAPVVSHARFLHWVSVSPVPGRRSGKHQEQENGASRYARGGGVRVGVVSSGRRRSGEGLERRSKNP